MGGFRHWNVRAFASKKVAQKFADKLNDILGPNLAKGTGQEHREKLTNKLRKFDPDVAIDYNGTGYKVEAIPLSAAK